MVTGSQSDLEGVAHVDLVNVYVIPTSVGSQRV
jgi:hypothetical protein